MIVCSCNVISDRDIEEATLGLLTEDPWRIIAPDDVYAAMRKHGKCCSCFPNAARIIARVAERFHRDRGTADERLGTFMAALENEHSRIIEMHRTRRHTPMAHQRGRTVAA